MKLIDWEKPLVSRGYPAQFVRKLSSIGGDNKYLVIATDGYSEYPIVVDEYGSGTNGCVYNKPEYLWVNIYSDRDFAATHPTKESADANAGTDRTARIKAEIGRFDV